VKIVIIAATLLATAMSSPSNAQTGIYDNGPSNAPAGGIYEDQPCLRCVAKPAPFLVTRPTLGWRPAPAAPIYTSRAYILIIRSYRR